MSTEPNRETMRSFYLTAFGHPSTYTLGILPKPTVTAADQVLIKVHAASLNPIDLRFAEGTLKMMMDTPTWPSKLGYDTSGVIANLGADAKEKGWNVGDEVFVRLPFEDRGSLSEYAVTSVPFIARKPKNVSHVEAASLPLVATTVLQALGRMEGGTKGLEGKRVLVTAGSTYNYISFLYLTVEVVNVIYDEERRC
ncbi:Zeta-crystallin [Arthrobotrys entomopaga]|nr:Zeta-crystallin [Arthrobotrys entomopaga]